MILSSFPPHGEEHLARLRQVFERLRHADLKLGAEKCTFATKEVSYLGHRVTEEGLLPDSALLAAIWEIPPPKTATEVRSFFGLSGYYRRYVKNFAAIAGPLHALTRKDAVFHWSADCQTAFDRLKTLLTTSPITTFLDFSQAFRLYTDASTAGLGVILAQVRDSKERIICCASRSLSQAEKAYPATKLECLAIVWAAAKFRPYLMAMPFEVFTDHYALQWLKTMGTGSALLHRWSAVLEEYDFTVHHRPGKAQTHVDGAQPVAGRLCTPPEDTLLHVQILDNEEEARKLAQELHSATHLGSQALWKLFGDRYSLQIRPSPLHGDRPELSPMSDGERLWSPSEDDEGHTVPRSMGHTLCGHCGTSARQPQTRIPHRVCRLLFEVHHPCPL